MWSTDCKKNAKSLWSITKMNKNATLYWISVHWISATSLQLHQGRRGRSPSPKISLHEWSIHVPQSCYCQWWTFQTAAALHNTGEQQSQTLKEMMSVGRERNTINLQKLNAQKLCTKLCAYTVVQLTWQTMIFTFCSKIDILSKSVTYTILVFCLPVSQNCM